MGREVEDIKARLDIVDVIQEYVPLKKAGSNYKGLCPFHQEKSPSFMASKTKQIWHCFGCHEGGDVFSFVQKIEGIDFYECLKILGQKAGVKISKQAPGVRDKKQTLLEILEISSRFFHKLLTEHEKGKIARDYLDSRSINEKTRQTFLMGYAPDAWDILFKFLLSRGYKQQDIMESGMVVYNPDKNSLYDRFRNRLMIPLRDVYGNVVGFTARALKEDHQGGKYINTPQTPVYDKSRLVFGLDLAKQAIKEAGHVVIVEGNMDVISSHQAGVMPVVAVSGTALTEQQVKILKRFTDTCIFAFDADAAGLMAARRGMEIALQEGMNVNVLTLRAGKDPDECIRQSVDLWKKSIAESKPVLDFLIQSGIERHDITTPQGKSAVAEDVAPLLSFTANPVVRDHYAQKLADELHISSQSVYELIDKVNQFKQKKPVEASVNAPTAPQKTPEEEASWGVIALCIQHPHYFTDEELKKELILTEPLASLYKNLQSYYDSAVAGKNSSADVSKHIHSLSVDLQTLYAHAELYGDKEFPDLTPQQCRQAYMARKNFLLRLHIKRELHRIQKSIKEAEEKNDSGAIKNLSTEFALLSRRISEIE